MILRKTFILKDGENPIRSEGTIIEWKEGKNITKKVFKKKTKKQLNSPHSNQEQDADSFFNFFKNINLEDK